MKTNFIDPKVQWADNFQKERSQVLVWQIITCVFALIGLLATAFALNFAFENKYIPYIVEVDNNGQIRRTKVLNESTPGLSPKVMEILLSDFIFDARMVTPDVALQRLAILDVYSKLAPGDPAHVKMNEFLNGNSQKNPFERSKTEQVFARVTSILQQTPKTWQVDWIETVRSREGTILSQKPWKAILTTYQAEVRDAQSEEGVLNPLGFHVEDFNWAPIQK